MARPGETLVEYAEVNILAQKLSVSNSCFVIPGLGQGVMEYWNIGSKGISHYYCLLLTLLNFPQLGQDGLILLAQSGLFQEIRPPFEGPSQGFRSSPEADLLMISRQEYGRDFFASESPWPGIMGVFQKSVLKGILKIGPFPP